MFDISKVHLTFMQECNAAKVINTFRLSYKLPQLWGQFVASMQMHYCAIGPVASLPVFSLNDSSESSPMTHGQYHHCSKSTWHSIWFLSASNSNVNDQLWTGSVERPFITSAAVFTTFPHWGFLTNWVFQTLLAPRTHLELYLNILPPANVSVHIPPARFSTNIKANNDDVLVYSPSWGNSARWRFPLLCLVSAAVVAPL